MKLPKNLVFTICIALLFFFLGFIVASMLIDQKKDKTNYLKVSTATEFDELVTESSKALRIDLRSREDFEAGHIPGFINISNKIDNELLATWIKPFSRGKKVILICYSGNLSAKAFVHLLTMGFTNISEFTPGYPAYVAQKEGSFSPETGSCDCPVETKEAQ